MFYGPVVVTTSSAEDEHGPRDLVVCSIECARHNGYEPTRMAMKHEYDDVCSFCGFVPADLEDHPTEEASTHAMGHASTARNTRLKKAEHPERFCSVPSCLWRIVTRLGPNPCRKHPEVSK